MTISRYYRKPTDSVFVPFTAETRLWMEVVVRALDANGLDIGLLTTLEGANGAGGFMAAAGGSYEIVFSDGRISYAELDRLRDPGQSASPGPGITVGGEAPAPSPPYPYLDVPFQVGNVRVLR